MISETISILSILVALLTTIITLLSLLHQYEISYPKIRVKNLYKYKESSIADKCLIYEKENRRVYLLAKFNITNRAPMAGSIYQFLMKYGLKNTITPLSKMEYENLPENFKKLITSYSKNSVFALNKKIKSKPFENTTITLVFKMPYERSVILKRKHFRLLSYYFGENKKKIKTRFSLSISNYLETLEIGNIMKGLKEQKQKDIEEENRMFEENFKSFQERFNRIFNLKS